MQCGPIPLLQDEAGVEGVAVARGGTDEKVLVVGKRFAVQKSKDQSHDNKEEQNEAYKKLQGKMDKVEGVEQARKGQGAR